MLRTLIRELRYLFRRAHKYNEGDTITVQFRIPRWPPILVRCRISKIAYLYEEPIYYITAHERVDWIGYGYRTITTEESIKCISTLPPTAYKAI
jgi:hypothetical protein